MDPHFGFVFVIKSIKKSIIFVRKNTELEEFRACVVRIYFLVWSFQSFRMPLKSLSNVHTSKTTLF